MTCKIKLNMKASYSENGNVQQPEQLTGQVNSQARTVADIVGEAVNQPTAGEQGRNERLALLDAMRITTATQVEEETYALSVDGVGIFALSDIHGLKGKQKSGKSAVFKVCLAALMAGQQFRVKSELVEPVVLFLDTEQQTADVKLIIDEVKRQTQCDDAYIDSHLRLYSLRRMSYDTLLKDTSLLIQEYHPQVVFIDGLVDYVASFNDEVMSRQLIHDLLLLCEEHKCAIVNILHENKAADDENMRGHLGTVLSQKAGTVLQCRKVKSGIINVTCPDARHGTMPAWNISFDGNGHLMDADLIHQQEIQTAKHQRDEKRQEERELILQHRLEIALSVIREHSGSVPRSTLTAKMEEQIGIKRPAISKFLTRMVKDGKLFESGKFIMDSRNIVLPI